MKRSYLVVAAMLLLLVAGGCKKENESADSDAFSFIVYPGARYLGQLTEVTKKAHKLIKPNEATPPVAIYDTDAPLEEVATFYAKAYGYGSVAPDATNNMSTVKPKAFYRAGDLAVDEKGVEPLLPRLGLNTDVTKAVGTYKAADIAPLPNRPRVTVQRPYFDNTTSQVVEKTLILMAR